MMKKKSLAEWQGNVIEQIELLSERDDQKQGEINLLRQEVADLNNRLNFMEDAIQGVESRRARAHAELQKAMRMLGGG